MLVLSFSFRQPGQKALRINRFTLAVVLNRNESFSLIMNLNQASVDTALRPVKNITFFRVPKGGSPVLTLFPTVL